MIRQSRHCQRLTCTSIRSCGPPRAPSGVPARAATVRPTRLGSVLAAVSALAGDAPCFTAYRVAFLVTAVLALVGAVSTLRVPDDEAAEDALAGPREEVSASRFADR